MSITLAVIINLFVIFGLANDYCVVCLCFCRIFIVVGCRKLSEKKMKSVIVRKDAIYDSLQQMIDNIKVLKSSDKKALYVQKLKDDIIETTHTALKSEAAIGALMFGVAALIRFGFPFVISYGAYLLSQGQIEQKTR